MARKRKNPPRARGTATARGSGHDAQPPPVAPAEEQRVNDLRVSELIELFGLPAPGATQTEQPTKSDAPSSVTAETKVRDLTVGELLKILVLGFS